MRAKVLSLIQVQAGRGGVIDARRASNLTGAALAITGYLKELEFNNHGNLSPLTISKYTQCLKAYETWLAGEAISQDTAQAFLNFLEQKNFSSATIQIYYHALRPFLHHKGILLHIKFKKNRKHNIPHPHNPAQVQAILKAAESRDDKWGKLAERDSLIILMFAHTGMRRQELLNLCVRDIDFFSHKIYVNGKGDKERVVPIANCLYDKLQKYTKKMGISDRIFPIQPRRLWKIVSKYARQAGVAKFSPHSFRHYFATQLVKSGVNLKVIKELLGHADISTTEIYVDIEDKDCTEAVEHLPALMGGKK